METSLRDFLKKKAAVYKAESEKNRYAIIEIGLLTANASRVIHAS